MARTYSKCSIPLLELCSSVLGGEMGQQRLKNESQRPVHTVSAEIKWLSLLAIRGWINLHSPECLVLAT